jgi:hypothetical protein
MEGMDGARAITALKPLPFKLNPQFFTQGSSRRFVICKIFGTFAIQFP